MKIFITTCFSLLFTWAAAQSIATFEEFDLPPESFLNGSTGVDGFASGDVFLPVDYNDNYGSFLGWAISNTTDTSTPGFSNQYSAITGSGYSNSAHYAITYAPDGVKIVVTGEDSTNTIDGFYVTNSTYAYLSMKDGDAFAKKFGGPSGDDPDFFKLTITAYRNGMLINDSIDFYLADFRFSNNTLDYIIDDWTWVHLSYLGPVDSLYCSLSSSDNGAFGMNTPAYFCLDHVNTSLTTSVPLKPEESIIHFFPNPARDILRVKTNLTTSYNLAIFNTLGKPVLNIRKLFDEQTIDLSKLAPGTYYIKIMDGNGKRIKTMPFIKQ